MSLNKPHSFFPAISLLLSSLVNKEADALLLDHHPFFSSSHVTADQTNSTLCDNSSLRRKLHANTNMKTTADHLQISKLAI